MFRSPNDVTSSDPESSSDGEEELGQLRKAEDDVGQSATLDQEAISSHGSLPEEQQTTVPNVDPSVHSGFMLSALLENHLLHKAAETLNEQPGSEHRHNINDPEVQALGKMMYTNVSQQFNGLGMIGPGFDADNQGNQRQAYLQGLGLMALNGLPDELSHDGGLPIALQTITDSGANRHAEPVGSRVGLRRLLTGADGSHEPNQAFHEELASLKLEGTSSRSVIPVLGLPSTIGPLNGRSSLPSRYATDFTQLGCIGKGGYGKVYRVVSRLDGQEYAIKKITFSPKKLQKFQGLGLKEIEAILYKEIRTLARLEHANVVRYYGGWPELTAHQSGNHELLGSTSPPKLLGNRPALPAKHSSLGDEFENRKMQDASEKDDGIIFDFSSESAGEDETVPRVADNRGEGRHMTTSSTTTTTRKSFVQSTGEDDGEVESIPREPSLGCNGESSTDDLSTEDNLSDLDCIERTRNPKGYTASIGPIVTIHIQMSLHPVSLTNYLSPDVSGLTHDSTADHYHCYHLEPSLRLVLAILSGVGYLHSQGIVHRDLKPANVFLSIYNEEPHLSGCVEVLPCSSCNRFGERVFVVPRIGDFGLVADIAVPEVLPKPETKATPENTGFVESLPDSPPPKGLHPLSSVKTRPVGTEFYRPSLSPNKPDEKLDIFSLGVVTFEFLWKFQTSGSHSVLSTNHEIVLKLRLTDCAEMERYETLNDLSKCILPPDFSSKIDDPSGKTEECIKGMLHPDNHQRYSCKEVRQCMEAILAQRRVED
ncbi:MAG: hypothetical protein M1827_002277 [Pycnora praestabilis]|nr:MAG: hypothetical protein M1827_002277 [Pycnora praestabilis]